MPRRRGRKAGGTGAGSIGVDAGVRSLGVGRGVGSLGVSTGVGSFGVGTGVGSFGVVTGVGSSGVGTDVLFAAFAFGPEPTLSPSALAEAFSALAAVSGFFSEHGPEA